MPQPIITRSRIFEDGSATFMARVVKADDGTNIAQADVTGITYSVSESVTGTEIVASTVLTVSAVVFDALQTTAIWTVDSTGFNFRHRIAETVFTTPGILYRIEYLFDPAAADDFWVVFEALTIGIKRT